MNQANEDRVGQMTSALEPLIGDKALRYKGLWLASDRTGKEQVEQLLQMEYARNFLGCGLPVLPPPQDAQEGEIDVGSVLFQDKPYSSLTIPKDALLQHAMIAGTTGCGKTTLIYQFCREFSRLQIPHFLFDFKLDYRPLLQIDESIQIFTIGSPIKPLNFNPLLEISKNILKSNAQNDFSPLFQLSDVLCRIFYAGHGVRSILNKAFSHLLQDWKDHQFTEESEPSFRKALAWIQDYEPKSAIGYSV